MRVDEAVSPFRSIPELFASRVEESAGSEAFRFPVDDEWHSLTWAQFGERVRAVTLGLHSLGVSAQECCGVLASTRLEWMIADLGVLCAGAATTTIYPSNTPDECVYILSDSDSRVVFAEDDAQVDKLRGQRDNLPNIRHVITFDGVSDGDWVLTLAELEERGRGVDAEQPGLFDQLVEAVQADDLATLIYTSGTTGRPKGVRLAHSNWLYAAEATHVLGLLSRDDLHYLWLPLSHSFGKVLQLIQLRADFATALDGRIPKLMDNLAVVRPTFMGASPRIFEKVYNRIVLQAKEDGGAKYRIFRWACGVGARVARLRLRGKEPSGILKLQYGLADRLVFSKLRERFGGRLRYFLSGSAPLSTEVAEFFYGAGIIILEAYGLTETSGTGFLNRPGDIRFGTVGTPLPGMTLEFAEDGEILVGGPAVMRGYHNLPDETAAVLDDQGRLRTGDIGVLEGDHLKITDRKKDLIKTSGGKYVAPQTIENQLKALCPYISNLVVHGDRRPYCTALVAIDEEAIAKWAEDNDLASLNYAQLTDQPKVRELVQASVDKLNAGLARHETIKSFAILPRDLTVETGEITPSLKLKRKVVEQRYQDLLDGMYSDAVQRI